MRFRLGFVSNSSSASFVLDKSLLSDGQLLVIRDHIHFGEVLGIEFCRPRDAWEISEVGDTIRLVTVMDNFDMGEFLGKIGALGAVIEREHS